MRDERECCHKTKERTEKEYKDLINRLNRSEEHTSELQSH